MLYDLLIAVESNKRNGKKTTDGSEMYTNETDGSEMNSNEAGGSEMKQMYRKANNRWIRHGMNVNKARMEKTNVQQLQTHV